jgi:hypothetical protein
MSTRELVEYECPLCDEKFKYWKEFSYSVFGICLDFMPYGSAELPIPVPKCPKCKLVFVEDLFSEEDINTIKVKIPNNNFFKLEPDMPRYYYLAKECELVNKSIDTIGDYYLSAIWENSNKCGNKKIFKKIANIIIKYFEKDEKKDKNYYINKLINIDFFRRLEKFEKAVELIETLKKDNDFPHDKFEKVLEYQLELINKKDTEEHKMPSE